MSKLTNALTKSISYISTQSVKDISRVSIFADYNCTIKTNIKDLIFPCALLLQALCSTQSINSSITSLKRSLGELIISKGDLTHSYNYYLNSNIIPPDLDDTAACIIALYKSNFNVNQDILLNILNLEIAEGGPYRTWYTDSKEEIWNDVDPTVNANFIYCAALVGINLPKTRKYLTACYKDGLLNSPYYPSKLMTIINTCKYLRLHKDNQLEKLVKSKLAEYVFTKLTIIEKILFIHSNLLLAKESVSIKQINQLLKLQLSDGSWPELPICYDEVGKTTTYVGSKIITTSLIIELLGDYLAEKENDNIRKSQLGLINQELNKLPWVKEILKIFPNLEKHRTLIITNNLANSYKIKRSLVENYKLDNLSVALVFGWCGYTIIDKIIDKELTIKKLIIANSLIRLSWKYYRLAGDQRFNLELNEAVLATEKHYQLQLIDSAQYDLARLELRMMPFLITIKYLTRILVNSTKQENAIYDIFNNIFLIEQLADDLTDWKIDLAKKTATYITSQLNRKERSTHQNIIKNKLLPEILEISTNAYKKAAVNILKINNNVYLTNLLDNVYTPFKTLGNSFTTH